MNSNNDDIKTNLFYKLINDNLYNPILLNIISQNIINPTINKIKPYVMFYIFSQCLIILLLIYIIYKKKY